MKLLMEGRIAILYVREEEATKQTRDRKGRYSHGGGEMVACGELIGRAFVGEIRRKKEYRNWILE